MADPNQNIAQSSAVSAQQYENSQAHQTSYVDASGKKKKGTSVWSQRRNDYRTAYRDQRTANQQAYINARNRAQSATDANIAQLNAGYQTTNRQLYRDYMQQQKNLPQQMAAQGYTGGLTESSQLRLGNAYGEALNTNEQTRLGQEASYNQALEQQLYEAQAARDAANNEALQKYHEQVTNMNEQRRQEEKADLEKRAAELAAHGDFSLYKKLGYTNAQIKYMEKMFKKEHPELFKNNKNGSGSGGGGYRGGGKKNGTKPFKKGGKGNPNGSDSTENTPPADTSNPNHDNNNNGNYQRWLEYQRQQQQQGGGNSSHGNNNNGNYQRWLEYQRQQQRGGSGR